MMGLFVSQVGLMSGKEDEGVDLERYIEAVKIRCDNQDRGIYTHSYDEIYEMIELYKRCGALYQDGNKIYVRSPRHDADDYPHIKKMIDRKKSGSKD